jgi:hypothetical protein
MNALKLPLASAFFTDIHLSRCQQRMVVEIGPPSRLAEVLVFNGLVVEDAGLLRRLYPERYKTRSAARWALAEGVWQPPGFEKLEFQLVNAQRHKGRVRVGYFDPRLVPDPIAMLAERLGCRVDQCVDSKKTPRRQQSTICTAAKAP